MINSGRGRLLLGAQGGDGLMNGEDAIEVFQANNVPIGPPFATVENSVSRRQFGARRESDWLTSALGSVPVIAAKRALEGSAELLVRLGGRTIPVRHAVNGSTAPVQPRR